jgi:hypothetical protein
VQSQKDELTLAVGMQLNRSVLPVLAWLLRIGRPVNWETKKDLRPLPGVCSP